MRENLRGSLLLRYEVSGIKFRFLRVTRQSYNSTVFCHRVRRQKSAFPETLAASLFF